MSLRVWLPLNGDLRNNGLSNITVTNNGATVDNNGKIGKCYSFSSKHLSIPNPITVNNEAFSISCWVYITGYSNGYSCIFGSRSQTAGKGIALWVTSTTIRFDDGEMWSPSYSFQLNTWTHITAVWSLSGKYIYVNGNLISSKASVSTLANLRNTLWIGDEESTTPTYCLKGKLNDFRIYDHALSVKEVKEISKGLVCHYKLDSRYITDNLIINGFGENGMENWSGGSTSTTEIPPNQSNIKASYLASMTKEYIPINQNHSYTISAWLKANNATSGTIYPSIYPYDYDKKFINYYNSADGFSNAYKTTLAQPLKKGDTKIYATDLSAWTTSTSNHFFHVAIFGYKDSTGYVYPDMVYTADSPSFGSKADKSNIDKTNNIVTLKSAFTGEDRPAGTTICQATEGSTYYYPFGGCGVGGLQDWTFKTANFTPKNTNRLKACKYIRWSTYNSLAYLAGNKLVDNNDNSTVVYDSSGYNYHGTPSGNLTVSSNSARNSLSIVFDGTDSKIQSYPQPSVQTISVWLKSSWDSINSGYKIPIHDYGSKLAIGFANNNRLISYVGSSAGGAGSCVLTTNKYIANQWNHIVVVKTGDTTRNVYINGELATNTDNNWWGGNLNKLNIGCRYSGSYKDYFDGQISDFRAYATALSAEDVKELYQTSASIDKSGNMFAYEFKED